MNKPNILACSKTGDARDEISRCRCCAAVRRGPLTQFPEGDKDYASVYGSSLR